MPDWRELYATIFLETNPTNLEKLIPQVERAVFERILELSQSANGAGELNELIRAFGALLGLKITLIRKTT